jgi:hypothetical protein
MSLLPDTPVATGVGAKAYGDGNAAYGSRSRNIDGEEDTLAVGSPDRPRNISQVKDATRDDHAVTFRQLRGWFNDYGGLVKDVVGTYADLLARPVTDLFVNDIIGILADETDPSGVAKNAYYRYVSGATPPWTLIGRAAVGLTAVSHDASLGGNGTETSPLYVAGPAETTPFIYDLSAQLDGARTVLVCPDDVNGPFNVFQNGKCLHPSQYSLAADRRTLTLYTSPQQAWPVEACWVQSLEGMKITEVSVPTPGPQGIPGPQGPQGVPGPSMPNIVDDLETDDSGSALSAAQGKVLDETKSDIIQSDSTYFIDGKFGDDSTGLFERQDKKFKTIEAVLDLEVDVPVLSVVAQSTTTNLRGGTFTLSNGIQVAVFLNNPNPGMIWWTDGTYNNFINSFTMPSWLMGGSGMVWGMDDDAIYYIVWNSVNMVSPDGTITIPYGHGFSFNLHTFQLDFTDWTAPLYASPVPPANPFGVTGWIQSIYRFENGICTYNSTTGRSIMFNLNDNTYVDIGPSNGNREVRTQDLTSVRTIMTPKQRSLFFSSGKYINYSFPTSGAGNPSGVSVGSTAGTACVIFGDYVMVPVESSSTIGIIPKSMLDNAANGSTVNDGFFMLAAPMMTQNSSIAVYKDTLYFGVGAISKLVIDSTSPTDGRVTAAHFESTGFNGGGGGMIPVVGGLYFPSTRLFYNIDGETVYGDIGTVERVLDISASPMAWNPQRPTSQQGAVLYSWPARFHIRGHTRLQTIIDLSDFTDGISVKGNDSWSLVYTNSTENITKGVTIDSAHITILSANTGTIKRSFIDQLINIGTMQLDDCVIKQFQFSGGPLPTGTVRRSLIEHLALVHSGTFLGCDIFDASNSAIGNDGLGLGTVFKGCRLPENFMVALPNATFQDCIEIY